MGIVRDPYQRGNAKHERRLSLQLVQENDKILGQRKGTIYGGTSPTAGRNSTLQWEIHSRKQNVEPLCIRCILEPAPWAEDGRVPLLHKVIGKDTLLGESLCAIQQQVPHAKWQFTPDEETLDLQKQGHTEEDEQDSKRIPCPFCSMAFDASTTFCVCGATQSKFSKGKKEQTHISLDGFDHVQALAKHEIPPQNRRSNINGQSKEQQHYGKAKGHCQEAVKKVPTLETPKKGGNAAQLRKEATWTESVAKSSVVDDEHEKIVKLATTQTPQKIRNSNA